MARVTRDYWKSRLTRADKIAQVGIVVCLDTNPDLRVRRGRSEHALLGIRGAHARAIRDSWQAGVLPGRPVHNRRQKTRAPRAGGERVPDESARRAT